MIQLYMKEENLSEQNRMLVKDQTGQDLFLIVGKWGRIGDKLSLYSLSKERLVEVKQKTLSIFPTFHLKINDQPRGKITKYPGLFGIYKPRYKVKELNWVITGDFEKREYTARKHAQKIMDVNKCFTTFGDFYSLTIYEEENAPVCCLISVIIDIYSPARKSSLKKLMETNTI